MRYERPAATPIRDFLEACPVEAPPLLRAGEKTAVPPGLPQRFVRGARAVRVRRCHGERFADGSILKHFAIVTNRAGDGLAVIRWHREKAGTVEHVQHVLKNAWAAVALLRGQCGATAAWVRLNVRTYNLLSALKRLAVPGDWSEARPKRWRFRVFTTVGTVLHPARRTLVRLTAAVQRELLARARPKILALNPT